MTSCLTLSRPPWLQTGCNDNDAICANGSQFVATKSEYGFNYDNDGVVGANFGSFGSGTPDPNPFANIMKSPDCKNKVFSFWLNRNTDDKYGGELTVCGTDTNHYTGDITYAPITSNSSWAFSLWQFKVDQLIANGNTIASNFQAAADTGTDMIVGPLQSIQAIYSKIGIPYYGGPITSVDCSQIDSLPSITLTISGRQFTLTGKDYVAKHLFQTSNGTTSYCQVVFAAGNVGKDNVWVFGNGEWTDRWLVGARVIVQGEHWFTFLLFSAFLGAFYSVFDVGNSRIGFATVSAIKFLDLLITRLCSPLF